MTISVTNLLLRQLGSFGRKPILDKVRILELECKWHVGRFIPVNMTSEEVEEAAKLYYSTQLN